MKWYKVICLSVGGLGNKIYELNEEVSENNFPIGNAEILEKEGYIKFIKSDDSVAIEEQVKKVELDLSDFTRDEIIDKLISKGILFSDNSLIRDNNLSKAELFEILRKHS